MDDPRTPLSRARGLGAAKRGVGHFIGQRVSGAALVILLCWGLSQTPFLVGGGYDFARTWLASPLNVALISLLLAVGLYHARLGMAVIIEDYVQAPIPRTALLILNVFVAAALGVVGIVSLLKVAFIGGGG